MTITKLSDEINQLADRIPAGDRFRTCDICHRLKPRRNGIQLVQVGVYLARGDDLRLITKGVWDKDTQENRFIPASQFDKSRHEIREVITA